MRDALYLLKHLYKMWLAVLPATTIGVLPSTITTTPGNRISTMATRTIHPVKSALQNRRLFNRASNKNNTNYVRAVRGFQQFKKGIEKFVLKQKYN